MTIEKTGPDCYSVVHGHPKKEGSKTDKPKGAIIKEFCGPGAQQKAGAMHQAITESQKAKDCKFNG